MNPDTLHVIILLSRVTLLKFDAIGVVCLIPILCSVYDLNRVQHKNLNLNLNGGYVFQETGKPEI